MDEYCYLATREEEAVCPREVKIGYSSRLPGVREREIAGQGNERYKIVACFSGGRALEAEAHRDLISYYRNFGEWYIYVPAVKEYFATRFPYVKTPETPYRPPVPKRSRAIRREGNPGSVAPKTGWSREPEGKFAKLVTYFTALDRAGSDWVLIQTSDWSSFGITESVLQARIERYMPGFFLRHPRRKSQCHNRLYYMFCEDDKKTGKKVKRISGEHPINSPSLNPYVQIAAQLYRKGEAVPLEDVMRLFS